MRIIKRANVTTKQRINNLLMALLLAVLTISLFLIILGHNPLVVYPAMFNAIFGTSFRLMTLIRYITPLVIVSLGISIAFKMRFMNIGGEGQLIMGAICASYFALFWSSLPSYILLPLMIIASIVGGGLYGLVAAILKVSFNTNETIVTLMLNYVALQLLTYLQYVAWKEGSFPIIANFSANALLPSFNGISSSIFIAVIITILTYLLLNKSKWGYEVSVIGESEKTAQYIGINLKKMTLLMIFISGAIIGLAGFVQVAGNLKTLSTGVTLGLGFTGVVIAWISKLDVKKIVVISILFACLLQATSSLDSLFKIPSYSVDVIQSIVLFFVIGSEFFNEYKVVGGTKR